MQVLTPSFKANCYFGYLNVNLGLTLTNYNYICINKDSNNHLLWVCAITLGNYELFIDHYSTTPYFLNRKLIKDFFDFCFSLKPKCSCLIAEDNIKSRKLVERLGFKQEGINRKSFDGIKNTISYGLLKEEFINKWR
jgi:hypothetical protein